MNLLIKNNADHVEMSKFLLYHPGLNGFKNYDLIVNGLNKKATQFDYFKYLEVGGLSIIHYKQIVFIQPLVCLATDYFTEKSLNIGINYYLV